MPGVHIGKCMVDMGRGPGEDTAENSLGPKQQERVESSRSLVPAEAPRPNAQTFSCREDRCYVVTGGLGG